jgi:hypothetical protein
LDDQRTRARIGVIARKTLARSGLERCKYTLTHLIARNLAVLADAHRSVAPVIEPRVRSA